MSFQAKTDYFGLSTGSGSTFVITDSSENKSAQVATGQDEKGDVVAYEVFGEEMSPACSYVISADSTLGTIKIGEAITVTGINDKKFTITSVAISTAAGSPPKIDVGGSQIPNTVTHTDCTYTIPAATLGVCHHAQILWSAFTLGGTGCYLTQANYTASGDLTRATKDGNTISFDIANGQLVANITIQQTGNTEPTVTAGTGWVITSPLTKTDSDASLPSWTCTISKYLTHDSQA